MQQAIQSRKSLRHFTKYLFLISKVYAEKEKSRISVYEQLQRMRKSIIRMTLSYTDIDKLKQKIDNLINWERKYAKYFKPEDDDKQELKNNIRALEDELSKEREEKLRIISEQEARLKDLTDSLESAKHKLRSLLLDKAKRHHRLKILEEKISRKTDPRGYFHS